MLLGEEELDAGEVIRHPKLRLGYLRQHDPFLPGETALGFPDARQRPARLEMRRSGRRSSSSRGPISKGRSPKLSGGWQTRVKLAALLLHEPNLLLLDEPTNFLDLRTQILLEHFLRNFKEACLIVSHDRAFLSATCTHTLDLSRGKLTMFPGKIDAFLEYQHERREHDERTNAAVLAKRRQLRRIHRQEQSPGQHRHPGPIEKQAARKAGARSTSPATSRRPTSGRRSSSRAKGRHCAAAT